MKIINYNLKENVFIRLTSNNDTNKESTNQELVDTAKYQSNEELNNIFKKIFYPPLGFRGVG